MGTEVCCKGFPGGLRASNLVEAENLEQFIGKDVLVTITIPRNLAFLRKFMVMIGVAYNFADTDYTKEQFRKHVTTGAGYCTFLYDDDGGCVAIPDSLKFSEMDDSVFERVYQDSITFICKHWVVNEEQLNEMLEFM